jgi:hypothetical protein
MLHLIESLCESCFTAFVSILEGVFEEGKDSPITKEYRKCSDSSFSHVC